MENIEQVVEPAAEKSNATVQTDAPDDDDLDQKEEPSPPAASDEKSHSRATHFSRRVFGSASSEVTQAEWKQVMATEPWNGKPNAKDGDDFPVTYVNWTDAMDFCRQLTEQEREAGLAARRLGIYVADRSPMGAQACRSPDRHHLQASATTSRSLSTDYAWIHSNAMGAGQQFAHRVGEKKPNPWGLHDMHGNVFEWCRDVYAQKLPGGRDPETNGNNPLRIFRGGSWCMEGSFCRSADRSYPAPNKEYVALGVGLRVALTVSSQAK